MATMAIAAISPPIFVPILAAALEPASSARDDVQATSNSLCMARSSVAALASLDASGPRLVIFAPIDLGAQVVEATPHAVVATPHHRNQAAIKSVISGFLAPPDAAAAIVRASGANIVIACPGMNEIRNYTRAEPTSLAAHLKRGDIPAWLKPVPLSSTTPIRAYRVLPQNSDTY